MVGAIIVSGFGRGEIISLTLAPLLLLGMLFLLYVRAGKPAMNQPPRP